MSYNLNICFLYGKIESEIEFKFIYNDRKYLSIVEFEMITNFNNNIKNYIVAYNEIADIIYSNYEKGDYINLIGTIEDNKIIVLEINVK